MDAATEPREGSMQVGDGRTVAWTEWGDADGTPLLRVPGTPGCRWSVRVDRRPWADRGLRVVTTERPGFGASTRLPGRRFREHADDLAAVLDHLGLDRVHLVGGSGAAPHELALCQYHPDRVVAATVVAGAAPVRDGEVDEMIPLNTQVWRLMRQGRREEAAAVMAPMRAEMLADPLAAFGDVMSTAPPEDLAVMADPQWREGFARACVEALDAGLDGWVDEAQALTLDWDVDPRAVPTSVTWYHAVEDRNCPVAAARRLVDALPRGRFVEWTSAGHLTAYHREGEILDELLARG
jgi:pimeloyl-ACP methyl ester carboxylesterase